MSCFASSATLRTTRTYNASLSRRPQVVMRAMRFRPCIDLHSGRVKQIVGGTLTYTEAPTTNFDTETPASDFALLYKRDDLPGGHVIMLGTGNESAAISALSAYPRGLQIGGGINPSNASQFLDAGASHVIVTSFVFRDGVIAWDRVFEMERSVGRERLVLDVSCRRRGDEYIVCTDRWQKWTDVAVGRESLSQLSQHCAEILVHAVDVEGKQAGVDVKLLQLLADAEADVPITYAGGVRSISDIELAKDVTRGAIDVTIGSALSIFGGHLPYEDAVQWQREQELVAAVES